MVTHKIYGNQPHVPVVFVNCDHHEGDDLWALLPHDKLILVCLEGFDWQRDLSPWPASVFKQNDFGGQADAYLAQLETLIPTILQDLDAPGECVLAGYSLAGLFALYAMYQTTLFTRIVSASGSVWFPDFVDYARSHKVSPDITHIYLSLGDKEAKSRHPLMKTVQECSETLYQLYQKEHQCIFEMNPGNHFKDSEKRLAQGIIWAIK